MDNIYGALFNNAYIPCGVRSKIPAVKDVKTGMSYVEAIKSGGNVAIICGVKSGVWCLDIDSPGAFKEVRSWGLPPTMTCVTSRGYKLFFLYNSAITDYKRVVYPGVEVLCNGHLSLIPPSIHPNGKEYRWVTGRGPDSGIADASSVFNSIYAKAAKQSFLVEATPIFEGGRNDFITSYVGKMANKGLAENEILLLSLHKAQNFCKPPLDPKEVGTIVKSIFRTQAKKTDVNVTEAKGYTFNLLENLKREWEKPKVSTGFTALDFWVYGFKEGEVIVFAARPGVGKSVLTLQAALNVTKQGYRSLIMSTEMTELDQWGRVCASMLRLPLAKITNGGLTSGDEVKIRELGNKMGNENLLHISDNPSPTLEQVVTAVKKVKPRLVVVDYIQQCNFGGIGNDNQRMGEFVKGLKVLARDEKLTVIIASQLNRYIEHRDTKDKPAEPRFSDLRDCGSLETVPDKVIFIENMKQEGMSSTVLTLTIAKHRNGPIGKCSLDFLPETVTIVDRG